MNLAEYNELCTRWHTEDTGQRLGQWLMNHCHDSEDQEIFYCRDKKEASNLFFNRYVVISPNTAARNLYRNSLPSDIQP
jgi:hypothetical protein